MHRPATLLTSIWTFFPFIFFKFISWGNTNGLFETECSEFLERNIELHIFRWFWFIVMRHSLLIPNLDWIRSRNSWVRTQMVFVSSRSFLEALTQIIWRWITVICNLYIAMKPRNIAKHCILRSLFQDFPIKSINSDSFICMAFLFRIYNFIAYQ